MNALVPLVAARFAADAPMLQPGLGGGPFGQLLLALVAIALVVIVGKFVLALAWRLITIGIVIVAVLYLLSVVGIF